MKKDNHKKKLFSFISVFLSILVYIGAIIIYLYAHGWRVDPLKQIFIKTGVLTVQSDPILANLYIDDESKGRTPKSVSLQVGQYSVSVQRDGYVEWKKDIEIKEEKSTPVFPWLIKDEIVKENIFLLQDEEYIQNWSTESQGYIYFLTKKPTTTPQLYIYNLYRFDTNNSFWDFSSNPRIVLTFESLNNPTIELYPSPKGILCILKITENNIVKNYLIDSNKSSTLDSLTELNLSQFVSYSMIWSKDNQYLMFESDTDLISFDIQKETKYLLLKKSEVGKKYVWNTDEQGFFYLVQDNVENETEDIYAYSLTQTMMDGSNPKVILSDIFFQKNTDFILPYREDTENDKYAPFTNSPESTKSVGRINEIQINQDAKGIYIGTETSSYWYNIDIKKYLLVSPYPTNFIQFAPDYYKFIFKDNNGYSVYTFLKEEGDHTVDIGAKQIKNTDSNTTDVNWISNSLYIWYVRDNSMYIADKDGDNVVEVLKGIDTLKYYVISFSRDNAFTFYIGEPSENIISNINIDSYTLR